jgi:type VI secretion system secreted protein VgrG
MLPTDRLPVTIDGTAVPLLLHWMRGREELGRLFEYELEIFSEDFALSFDAILGKPLTVCVSTFGGVNRFFNGIITHLRRVESGERYQVFRAILSPKLWVLQKTTDCRIYQQKSVPDVVKEVLREHAIAFSERLQTGDYKSWDYLTQYRESDFAFLSRIMEREGIYYYFKHTVDGHELVLSDSVGSHDPVPGYDLLPLRPPGTAQTERDHLTAWRIAHQITSLGTTFQAHDFRLARGADIKAVAGVPAEHEQDEYQIYDYVGHYVGAQELPDDDAGKERASGEHYARVQLDELRTNLERLEGEGNARGMQTGALFQFEDLSAPTAKFLVTSTHHELRNPQFESGHGGGNQDDVCHLSFSGIDSKRQFRPARSTRKAVVFGPESALVVGKKGEDITTDPYGRVRIQFHWDREGKSDETSTCWVRVAQMWAGARWGSMYIPRIGHEVIVQFLGGDPDRPIITGSVYNNSNMPPYTLPDNKTQSGIKSRSTLGGGANNFNEIRFEDKKGSEELFMQAEKNKTVKVKNDRSATIGANDSISVGGDRSVHVTGNLAVTVDGGGKSPNHSSHSVTGKYNLHASDTIEGDAPTHIKLTCGGSSILIEPDKITLMAGGQAVVVLDANVLVQSSAGSAIVLDANAFTKASGGGTVLLDANVLAQSKAVSQLLLDGNSTLTSKADVKVGGANVELSGDQKVAANGGGAELELSAAGANLSGSKVGVSGQSMTEITGAVVKIN